VARVGNAYIYLSDLLRSSRDDEARAVPVPGLSQEQLVFRIRYERLDRLVVRETLRQEAVEMDIQVTDEEVEAWINDAGSWGTPEVLGRYYPWLRGLSGEEFREAVRVDMMVFQAGRKRMGEISPVTDGEVRRFYEEHRETLRTPAQIKTFVILIRKEGRTREEALRKINAIRESLVADLGAAETWEAQTRVFADYARLYSEHPESDMGGYWVVYNTADDQKRFSELEKAARELPLRTLSEVREMPDAFFITMVESLKEPELPPFELAAEKIRRLVMRERNEDAQNRLFQSLKEKYRPIVYRENILGCGVGEP